MNKHITILLITAALVLASCGGKQQKKSYDEMGESGLTTRTEHLRDNLRAGFKERVIIGQIYGTLQGVGWTGDSARSDMKTACGDGPAAVGYSLNGIERGASMNSDSISFDAIRHDVLLNFRKGALITMTWTPAADAAKSEKLKTYVAQLAKYLDTLQDDYGIKAPVVLFPYPLDGASWYASLPAADYQQLFHQTVSLLKEQQTTNAIFGFATSGQLDRCPVDDIDVVEVRRLLSMADSSQFQHVVAEVLPQVCAFAQEHFKAIGLTTGIEGNTHPTFYSQQLLPLLEQNRLSYLMLGRNYGHPEGGHYHVPYPGAANELMADFTRLYNAKSTLFQHDLNGLYLSRP